MREAKRGPQAGKTNLEGSAVAFLALSRPRFGSGSGSGLGLVGEGLGLPPCLHPLETLGNSEQTDPWYVCPEALQTGLDPCRPLR